MGRGAWGTFACPVGFFWLGEVQGGINFLTDFNGCSQKPCYSFLTFGMHCLCSYAHEAIRQLGLPAIAS